jgi:hypothetical protein
MPKPLKHGFLQIQHAAVDCVQAAVPPRQRAGVLALLVTLARLRERKRRPRRTSHGPDVLTVAQGDVAAELGCGRACAARLLREAERAGLVRVSGNAGEGRTQSVALLFFSEGYPTAPASDADDAALRGYLNAVEGERI